MKKLLLAVALWLWTAPAFALVCPSVPNVFVNGSVADANQMNANFTTLLNCFNTNVATPGANTNISSLLGLASPPSGTGSLVFWGGTAGGTGNAITLASTNPGGFSLVVGDTVMFLAAAANTGPATVNVVGSGVVNLDKVNYTGVAALVGGEIAAAGQMVAATWDGTEFVMLSYASPQITVSPPYGRLTLTTGVPALSATVTAATTVYYTPYRGASVPLWSGAVFNNTPFSEVSQLLSDATKSPAAAVAASVYDMFVWSDAGTVRVSRGPVWTNATSRSAGTAVARVNGILVNSVSITNGPAAGFGTYVGTIATDAGGATVTFNPTPAAAAGGPTNGAWVGLWNQYNRVQITLATRDNTASWAYTTATWRQADASANNAATFVSGQSEDQFFASYIVAGNTVQASGTLEIGIALDAVGTPVMAAQFPVAGIDTNIVASGIVNYAGAPTTGKHVVLAEEYSANSLGAFKGVTTGSAAPAMQLLTQVNY